MYTAVSMVPSPALSLPPLSPSFLSPSLPCLLPSHLSLAANKAEVKAEGEGRSLGDSEESGRSPGDSERSPEDSGAERKLGANVVAVGPDDVSVARDVDSNESGSGTGKEPATVGVEAVDGEAGVAGGVGVAESSGEGGPGTEGLELSSHNVQSEGHEEL